MKAPVPEVVSKPVNKLISYSKSLLIICIAIATVICVIEEILLVIQQRQVTLSHLMMLFIYLEVFAMLEQYLIFGKIPVRYPIYITIIAIARFLLLGMKEMDTSQITALAIATLILTLSTTFMRIGHHYWPYKKIPNEQ